MQIQEVILKNSIIIVQISKEDIFNQCTAVVPILYNLLQSVSSHKTDHMASWNKQGLSLTGLSIFLFVYQSENENS